VDVDELEQLLEQAQRAAADEYRDALLEQALGLFQAEPLAGCDYAWSESFLRSLHSTYTELLDRVARARLHRGDACGAIDAAERGLSVDVLNEGLWRLALEAEGELGLREAIEARYSRLKALLDERLGLEPDWETRKLYLELLGQSRGGILRRSRAGCS